MTKLTTDQPSRIEPPKGHKPPKSIEGTEPKKQKPPPHGRKKSASHVLVAQSAYQETLPAKERERLVIDRLPEDWPEGLPLPDNVVLREGPNRSKLTLNKTTKGNIMDTIKRKAGQKVTEWLLAIATVVWRKVRDWAIDTFLSFGVYRKDSEGNPVPKLDTDGDPVIRNGTLVYQIAWGATVLSVLAKWRGEIAFLGTYLGYQIGGATVFEWLERIVAVLGI